MPLLGRHNQASISLVRDRDAIAGLCQILDASSIPNGAGGSSKALVPLPGGPFRCLVSQRREMPLSASQSGVTTSIGDYKVKFSASLRVQIKVGQKIRILADRGRNEALYDVIGVNDGETNRLQVIAECKLAV